MRNHWTTFFIEAGLFACLGPLLMVRRFYYHDGTTWLQICLIPLAMMVAPALFHMWLWMRFRRASRKVEQLMRELGAAQGSSAPPAAEVQDIVVL